MYCHLLGILQQLFLLILPQQGFLFVFVFILSHEHKIPKGRHAHSMTHSLVTHQIFGIRDLERQSIIQ